MNAAAEPSTRFALFMFFPWICAWLNPHELVKRCLLKMVPSLYHVTFTTDPECLGLALLIPAVKTIVFWVKPRLFLS